MEIVGEIVAIVVGFGLLALICKVVGEHIGKKRDEKIEQNQPIEIQQKPKITIHYKDRPAVPPLELARNMLVSYYMDMGEDTTKSVGMESEFDRKRDIIELKIRHLIENEETNHGSFFLTADTDKDEKAKAIISSIGKSCFAITMFYVYGMENSFPDTPFEKVICGMLEVLDDNEALDELERTTPNELFQNAYFEDMIKGKIKEQGT